MLGGSFSLAWGSAGQIFSSLHVLPSVLWDAVHPVAWSCLVGIFSLRWAWTVIATGRGC